MNKLSCALISLCFLAVAAMAAPVERWLYSQTNLQVDENATELEDLWRRAAKAGYTHVLLADSKMAKLGDVPAHYFRNLERMKKLAAELKLEVVPALFHMGYSEAMLWHDPNLAEALPVKDALFVVKNGVANVVSDPPIAIRGGDMSNLSLWSWKDPVAVADSGAVRMTDPEGRRARIAQHLKLTPFRQYHLTVRVKTAAFRGKPEVKLIAGERMLNYADLGIEPTQDWTTHHVIFNSLDNSEAQLYLGCWDGTTGTVWWDDCTIEEAGLVNLVRRPGAPLTVRRESGGALVEGRDFETVIDLRSGVIPWKGEFEVWHQPPGIKTSLPDGTRLCVSYYHAITVNNAQATICPSEPKTYELLRDEARRVHVAWGAKGYMMSHDEIRVWNWCAACQKRNLDAGALLADNARRCVNILREINPGGRIYIWNDMFDPTHNAHDNYYLVRGSFRDSWEGLDKDVIIVNWNFGRRDQSLKWFAELGHPQILAGYYDGKPGQILQWLESAKNINGVQGVMYTTWRHRFDDLEKFAELAAHPGQ